MQRDYTDRQNLLLSNIETHGTSVSSGNPISHSKIIQPSDDNGYIVPISVLVPEIQALWQPVISAVKELLLSLHADFIHSIYVRGSVAAGCAIANLSDIDFLVVTLFEPKHINNSYLETGVNNIRSVYPFINGIDLDFVQHVSLFGENASFGHRFLLKTQTKCVFGRNLAIFIEPFAADKKTARGLLSDFGAVLTKIKSHPLQHIDQDIAMASEWRQWIIKRLLRSTFLLAMDKAKLFTRDLTVAYEVSCLYFPEKRANLKAIYDGIADTSHEFAELEVIFLELASWILKQSQCL